MSDTPKSALKVQLLIALCVLIAGCSEPEVMPEGCVEFWSGSQRWRDCGEDQYFRDLKINSDWTKVMDCKRIENGWKCEPIKE